MNFCLMSVDAIGPPYTRTHEKLTDANSWRSIHPTGTQICTADMNKPKKIGKREGGGLKKMIFSRQGKPFFLRVVDRFKGGRLKY